MALAKELPLHKIYKEPTEADKRRLYEFYELLFDSHFTLSKKRSVMRAVLGYETWSWRVVGISEEAIKAIARNNFNKPVRKLARDHTKTAATTYKIAFERKMQFEEWWNLIWENDKTILITNDEHHFINAIPISKIYPLNPTDSYFVDAEVAGWHQTQRREGAQEKLGFMYAEGDGVNKNVVKAHMWLNLAAADGDINAILGRKIVEESMTKQQVAEAQMLANECLARNYKGC